MKSELSLAKPTPPRPINYPLLAESEYTGAVVLFTEEKVGTLLYRGTSCNEIGHYNCEWSSVLDRTSWRILQPGEMVKLTQTQ